jgi:DNA-binding GntR family transcriptional regulator
VTDTPRLAEESASLSEQAYRVLYRLIVSCELAPGSRISELQLQDLSGQPRTPTREAAMRLINDQLLEVIPRRGYRIAPLTIQSAEQILDVFDLLMDEVMRQATFDPRAAARLRSFIDNPPSDDDPSRIGNLLDFSDTLGRSVVGESVNPWLRDILGRLLAHVERLWSFSFAAPMADLIEFGYRPILTLMESDPSDRDAALEAYKPGTRWIREITLSGMRTKMGDTSASTR